jgi:hypothetical protein
MDVIANIVSCVLTFIAGVIGNIVAHDICATADTRCSKIIRRAAKRLAHFDVEATEQEWLADLNERETLREKYRHAIGCYLAAPRMRHQAMTVRIAIKFKVNSVGTVPCNIRIDPTFGTAVLNALCKESRLSKTLFITVVMWHFGKILFAAHKLGPGSLQRFLREVKNLKTWEFDVKAGRKGLTVDFSKVLRLYVLDRQAGIKALQRYSEILTRPAGSKSDLAT